VRINGRFCDFQQNLLFTFGPHPNHELLQFPSSLGQSPKPTNALRQGTVLDPGHLPGDFHQAPPQMSRAHRHNQPFPSPIPMTVTPFWQLRSKSEERPAIVVPEEQGLTAIPTAHHVIPRIDNMDAKRSCHQAMLSVSPQLSTIRD
jgi:hypothetical protein